MTVPSGRSLNIDRETFTAYSSAVQAAALTTTRLAATSLPADLSFHRSVDPALAHDVNALSDRVLTLASKLVHLASGRTNRIREEEDVVDEFVRNVVDPMEGMLESTDGALDVFLCKRKDPAIPVPAVPVDARQGKPKKQPLRGRLDPTLTHASNIQKPQLSFKYSLSNKDESPYIPATLLPHKWSAQVPLGYIFHDDEQNRSIEDVHADDDEEERKKRTLHPYYYELTHPSYPDHLFSPPVEPVLPSSLGTPSHEAFSTPHSLVFVSTPKAFLGMAHTISSATELAVDLEHHSYRSYKGFLALMQISTRQADFIVDLLVPEIREGLRQAKDKNVGECEQGQMACEAGAMIAKIFADPSVVKVFHGAESDIVWLQQDFNIFVVGLFDTFHASKLMEFPKLSLAYLLETYCNFIPDKRYQLADWRIRPLPDEMLTYACSDTHFLLYIYDMLRLSLIERLSTTLVTSDETHLSANTMQAHRDRDLIYAVLARSSRTALRLYENEVYDAEGGTGSGGWGTLARKWNKYGLVGSPQARTTEVQGPQSTVYKVVHRWREDVAREEDESTRYVLPTHHLFLLAERIPTTVLDLHSLFGGAGGHGIGGSVPPALKRRAGELVVAIKDATEATNSTCTPRESAEDRYRDAKMASTTVKMSEATCSTTLSSSDVKWTNEAQLWAAGSSSTSLSTASISRPSLLSIGLFGEHDQEKGVVSPPISGEAACLATWSVLFGSALGEATPIPSSTVARSTLAHVQASGDSAERFKLLKEKIHKTLAIAPVMSMPSLLSSLQTSDTLSSGVPMDDGMDQKDSIMLDVSDPTSTGPVSQIEIPFIPAHQRQTLSNPQNDELKDDVIVVVGQASARQRKRKRDKARGVVLTSTSTSDHDREMNEFDYSSVPNLLDNESKLGKARAMSEEGERSKKKQRSRKGPGPFEYGDFRAPPRDHREVKSGNKTHTFR